MNTAKKRSAARQRRRTSQRHDPRTSCALDELEPYALSSVVRRREEHEGSALPINDKPTRNGNGHQGVRSKHPAVDRPVVISTLATATKCSATCAKRNSPSLQQGGRLPCGAGHQGEEQPTGRARLARDRRDRYGSCPRSQVSTPICENSGTGMDGMNTINVNCNRDRPLPPAASSWRGTAHRALSSRARFRRSGRGARRTQNPGSATQKPSARASRTPASASSAA